MATNSFWSEREAEWLTDLAGQDLVGADLRAALQARFNSAEQLEQAEREVLIAALIVFFLGGIAAQFVGNTVTALAARGGITNPGRLGKVVQYLISVIVVIIALGVMGMDTALLVTSVTIMIASFGLAIGLALGLGARRIIQHILAGYYMRQQFRAGQVLSFDEVSGTVTGIGGVNTVVETPEGLVVFPNGVLLESVMRSPQQPPLQTATEGAPTGDAT